MKNKFFLVFFIVSQSMLSQEIFHEIEVGKKIIKPKGIIYNIYFNWKQDYKDFGWKRFGNNLAINKRFNSNWLATAGLESYYIADKNAPNFLELRPFLMMNLKTKITSRIYFAQFLKTEWRFFFYSNEQGNENYHRLRYRTHFDIMAYSDSTKDISISIKPGIEWYLLHNIANGERYANSREYYLRFSIEKGLKEWNFGYKLETFFKTYNPNSANGNTIFFEYKF
jgi:hypothetical protein